MELRVSSPGHPLSLSTASVRLASGCVRVSVSGGCVNTVLGASQRVWRVGACEPSVFLSAADYS